MKEKKITHDDGFTYVVQYEIDENNDIAIIDVIKYQTGKVVTDKWFENNMLNCYIEEFKETTEEMVGSLIDNQLDI